MYHQTEPFNHSIIFCTPTISKVVGVMQKEFKEAGEIFCNFRTFGGTETTVNGVFTLMDTADVTTWYRPDITAGCQFKDGTDVYEMLGTPEDIEKRHQYMKFKIRRIAGGA